MKSKKGIISALLLASIFSSCDDGRLYEELIVMPEEGRVAKLTGQLVGTDNWASGYQVVVAGFTSESEYATIIQTVAPRENGQAEVMLPGIGDEVESIEFCVVNRLRKRVVTFQKADVNTTDTIRLDIGTMNIGMYATIQDKLFNTTCVSCHGGSNFAAKGLYLTSERSHEALVNVPSAIRQDSLLVNPGNASASILYDVLATDLDETLSLPHSEMITTQATPWKNVVRDWINHGAKK